MHTTFLLSSAHIAFVILGWDVAGGGSINHSRLVQLLLFLARDEEPAYKRRSVSSKYPFSPYCSVCL